MASTQKHRHNHRPLAFADARPPATPLRSVRRSKKGSVRLRRSAIMPVLPHPGAHWWEQNEARAAERRSESERVAAYYGAQERAREEREKAAVRARVGQEQG